MEAFFNCLKKNIVVLLWIFCLLNIHGIYAQDEEVQKYEKDDPTKNIEEEVKVFHKEHDPTDDKLLRYLIKKDTRGTLAGNKCVLDATHRMGFEYLASTKGDPGYKNEFYRWKHNFGVKSYLFFTRGPFWKFKIKKKIKDCRYLTGDYVG